MPDESEAVLTTPSPSAVRDELTEMVVKDLLGPAGGPDEELSQYEDHAYGRYLVGMLAPKSQQVEPGKWEELETAQPDDPEVGATDTAAPTTDSFFPTAMGLSFVVEADAKAIVVKSEWGRYARAESATQTKKDGSPARAFRRKPFVGDPVVLPLKDGGFGLVKPRPDSDPYVTIQGRMRQTENGWVVTVFMVNTQDEPKRGKDEAWIFQPKMWVADAEQPGRAIFVQRRNWRRDLTKMDPLTREETETLEMLYRWRMEFAVGHGVSVHVTLPEPGADRATMVETEFVPRAEVEQQTPPSAADNADLADLILDMKELAGMPKPELVANLRRSSTAYENWIVRERGKLGNTTERLGEHQGAAQRAIQRCERACARIREGVDLIERDAVAESPCRWGGTCSRHWRPCGSAVPIRFALNTRRLAKGVGSTARVVTRVCSLLRPPVSGATGISTGAC